MDQHTWRRQPDAVLPESFYLSESSHGFFDLFQLLSERGAGGRIGVCEGIGIMEEVYVNQEMRGGNIYMWKEK